MVPYLVERGHKVLNLDLKPLDAPGVNTVLVDLADSGETFNALSMHFGFDDLRAGGAPAPLDAVVHFAAIPRILMRPDNAMFVANVLSTYNVVEAAIKLGVRKVVIASSITAYGVCFAEGDRDYTSFPVDEDYDADPTDNYGLSKLVGEKIARSFVSRTGADIYALRISVVIQPVDYERFPTAPPTRSHASGTRGAISTSATWLRLSISALRRTASVFRCSTPQTTRSSPTSPRWRSCPGTRRRRREGENWAALKLRCPTGRRANCWASARSTIRENTPPVSVGRQLSPARTAVFRLGDRRGEAPRRGASTTRARAFETLNASKIRIN